MKEYKDLPRGEYPRPDRVRENWLCLNGEWDFAFDEEGVGIDEGWMYKTALDTKITVPFVYQCELSGINDKRHIDFIWYTRTFKIPAEFAGKRVLLHFGAVDYKAKVWLNGHFIGEHEGGYTPFSFDITHNVKDRDVEYQLTVCCEDTLGTEFPRGKQSYRPDPFDCWYTPSSGIWQPVWLEAVGMKYIKDVRITPDYDNACFKVETLLSAAPRNGTLKLDVTYRGKFVTSVTLAAHENRFEPT